MIHGAVKLSPSGEILGTITHIGDGVPYTPDIIPLNYYDVYYRDLFDNFDGKERYFYDSGMDTVLHRAKLPVAATSHTLMSDSIDSIQFTSLPNPTLCHIDVPDNATPITDVTITSGTLTFVSSFSGTYKLTLRAYPYKDYIKDIIASPIGTTVGETNVISVNLYNTASSIGTYLQSYINIPQTGQELAEDSSYITMTYNTLVAMQDISTSSSAHIMSTSQINLTLHDISV